MRLRCWLGPATGRTARHIDQRCSEYSITHPTTFC